VLRVRAAKEVIPMKCTRWLPAVAMTAALAVGGAACDHRVREAQAPRPAPATTDPAQAATAAAPTEPAQVAAEAVPAAPETEPAAAPQPVLSFLMIDGLGAQFPPTKLLLHADGGKVRAELFSDLPKSALAHYEGNELYLEMDLDGGEGPQKVDGAAWRFKATNSEKADSPNGIFLNGQRQHLQPSDVLIRFERQGEQFTAHVMGQFRAFQSGTPEALAPFVGVRGSVPVEIVEKR
jgi:hypothetical protein